MNYFVRQYTRLILVALLAAGCLLPPGYARAEGSENTQPAGIEAGRKIAVILAISGQPLGVIPIQLNRIRATGSYHLTAALSEQGFTVIPPGKMLSLMREWRVRDGKSIPQGFLDSMAEGQGAELLLVANLVVQPGRLIMTGRYVDIGSATLLKVNMAEWIIGQAPSQASGEAGPDWLTGIQEACKIIGDANLNKPDPGREPMLILAAQPVGCSESTALIATHALLEYYVEHGRWDLIDPAVVASTLQDAGYSGKYFGAEARALLRDTFACSGLMIPGLISYDPDLKNRRLVTEYDEEVNQAAPMLSDFALSLRLVDLASGSITAGREVFLEVLENTGWFGIPNKATLMTRLQATAGRLWSDIHSDLEEF
jgi:hypothetical protein